MNGLVAALTLCVIGTSGYVGYGLGQLDGLTTAANIKREQETLDWAVATMMAPIWKDYCQVFPEKCRCESKR